MQLEEFESYQLDPIMQGVSERFLDVFGLFFLLLKV